MASYMVAAINKNYAGKSNRPISTSGKKPALIEGEALRTENSKTRLKEASVYFASQPADWKQARISEFENELRESGNSLVLAQYRKKGLESSMVAANFYQRFYSCLN
jgi:hypothetical protein